MSLKIQIPPWAVWPDLNLDLNPNLSHQTVHIMGAGLAGCALSYVLGQAGFKIKLYDEKSSFAQGASGNPRGLLMPSLSSDFSLIDQYYSSGFLKTREYILNQSHLNLIPNQDFDFNGVRQYCVQKRLELWANNLKNKLNIHPLLNNQDKINLEFDFNSKSNLKSLFYNQSGWVKPQKLCESFIHNTPHIELYFNQKILDLDLFSNLSSNKNILIYCLGAGSNKIKLLSDYPIYSAPGQLTEVIFSQPHKIKYSQTFEKYIIPLDSHKILIGATYRKEPYREDLSVKESENQENINGVLPYLKKLDLNLNLDLSNIISIKGYTAARPVTIDHLPLIGPIMSKKIFSEQFKQLALGGSPRKSPEPKIIQNQYIFSGFGSKGLSGCLIGAEFFRDQLLRRINNDTQTNLSKLTKGLHPARFWFRELARGG